MLDIRANAIRILEKELLIELVDENYLEIFEEQTKSIRNTLDYSDNITSEQYQLIDGLLNNLPRDEKQIFVENVIEEDVQRFIGGL